MPDTLPPPKTERQSVIPILFNNARERVSGFFGFADEPAKETTKSKQSILMEYFSDSGYKIINPERFADIMMGRNLDIDILGKLVEDAEKTHPEAVVFFREKIAKIE